MPGRGLPANANGAANQQQPQQQQQALPQRPIADLELRCRVEDALALHRAVLISYRGVDLEYLSAEPVARQVAAQKDSVAENLRREFGGEGQPSTLHALIEAGEEIREVGDLIGTPGFDNDDALRGVEYWMGRCRICWRMVNLLSHGMETVEECERRAHGGGRVLSAEELDKVRDGEERWLAAMDDIQECL